MDEKQAVFEQLSDFKKWSFTALRTLKNFTIIMTSNSDNVFYESDVFISVA